MMTTFLLSVRRRIYFVFFFLCLPASRTLLDYRYMYCCGADALLLPSSPCTSSFSILRPTTAAATATATTMAVRMRIMVLTAQQNKHTSDYSAKEANHPKGYKDNPAFQGPLRLPELHVLEGSSSIEDEENDDPLHVVFTSADTGRERIRHYYERQRRLLDSNDNDNYVDDDSEQEQQQQQQSSTSNNHHNTITINTATPTTLTPDCPTQQKLRVVVQALAQHNAPVDVKEVAESMEFVLRTRKRLLSTKTSSTSTTSSNGGGIVLYDLCCGHGLTGMLLAACCTSRAALLSRVVLVDVVRPPSHDILREILSQVCPWIVPAAVATTSSSITTAPATDAAARDNDREDHATTTCHTATCVTAIEFRELTLQALLQEEQAKQNQAEQSSSSSSSTTSSSSSSSSSTETIVIATHACGDLTDQVLTFSMAMEATSVAVMPCCYTGTANTRDHNKKKSKQANRTATTTSSSDAATAVVVPYGIQRAFGVAWSADIRRSFTLEQQGYHVDIAAIPRAITPMNRILIGQKKKRQSGT